MCYDIEERKRVINEYKKTILHLPKREYRKQLDIFIEKYLREEENKKTDDK